MSTLHSNNQGHVQDRQQLFDSSERSSSIRHRRRRRGDRGDRSSTTASEAQHIQKSLQHTQHLLSAELERVQSVQQALQQDQELLQDTLDDHSSLNIKQAKKALTNLERAQKQEQRVLLASIIFFWSVVVYILWSRLVLHVPFLDALVGFVTDTIWQRIMPLVKSKLTTTTE